MRKWILAIVLAALPGFALASSEGAALDKANIDPTDKASLQRGAKLFVNYCMGCHSADYQRYNRLARDIGLSDEQVRDNLIFTGAKVGEGMRNAMPKKDAKKWFGAAPPDLTLIARARGVDYLYTYLRTFYIDEARPWGVNNAAFPLVGMPHVLSELQGWQKARAERTRMPTATSRRHHRLRDRQGYMVAEVDQRMTGQLHYVAEPVKLYRQSLGVWVIAASIPMTAVFYLLKKEYWKDIH